MSSEPNLINETVESAVEAGPIGAFGLNTQIFAAQLINFVIVLLVLWRFAYRPVVAMIEAREEKIRKSLEDAEAVAEERKKAEAETLAVLTKARQTAQDLLLQAEAEGKNRQIEATAKARQEVEKLVAQGRAQLTQDREAMMKNLKDEVATLAVQVATRVLADQVDEKRSLQIATKALKEISS